MRNTGFIYDDVFLRHEMPLHHPESKERLISILNTLKNTELWDRLIHIGPRKADYSDIALVHTKNHIEKVRSLGSGYLDADTYLSKGSLEASLHSAGAVMEAVERCKRGEIEMAFCAVRPPGHHAKADRAMGFCIFNNIAIGARYAQKIGYKKVFIVDFDVHHGNGTQDIFDEDDTVYFFSTHQYPHYPGTGSNIERGRGKGAGYTYNVAMRAGAGNKEYLYVYQDILPQLVAKFSPDIILVSAGYDICMEDSLSGIRVSREGVRSIVQSILSCSENPVVFTLEGGYDLSALGESVRVTIKEMLLI
ncbi:histone deacetylase [Thermodesulfovibrionales bacterium]|nr:histone deacetylase [Thermodesulfovibrionales bacterium]MCL0083271.1 histone deacetylase [Thermodesulfovibrionales bacterium]MCL0084884.1 histone deacetylase [Thermodesulfovibrionales bacterium]MCL0106962.1 histone deacetylase [Thermodesulfovibrionales bacterium]